VLPSPVGLQARPFLQFHLQRFDPEDHVVGRGHEMMLGVAVHQQHPSAADRNHLHHPVNEMVEDLLNGEIARERARELHQNRRQPLLIHHPSPHAQESPCATRVRSGIANCERHFTPSGDHSPTLRIGPACSPTTRPGAPAARLRALRPCGEPRWRTVWRTTFLTAEQREQLRPTTTTRSHRQRQVPHPPA